MGEGRQGLPLGSAWRARLDRLVSLRVVREIRSATGGYTAAGGGLLAAGLAYAALFALVPGLLLILGVAGVVLGDGRLHDRFVMTVIDLLPPVRELLVPAVDEVVRGAGSITVIGIAGLAWGASRFYASFELALARVFGGTSSRGFVRRTTLGFLSVAVLGLVFLLATILSGVRALAQASDGPGERLPAMLVGLAIDLAGLLTTTTAVGAVYRLVPRRRARWRAIALPAAVVTAVLVVVARLFVLLAPRLIGAAAVLGTVATAFAALAWLSLSFQAILLGAAWVDARDRAAEETAIAPS